MPHISKKMAQCRPSPPVFPHPAAGRHVANDAKRSVAALAPKPHLREAESSRGVVEEVSLLLAELLGCLLACLPACLPAGLLACLPASLFLSLFLSFFLSGMDPSMKYQHWPGENGGGADFKLGSCLDSFSLAHVVLWKEGETALHVVNSSTRNQETGATSAILQYMYIYIHTHK